MEKEKSEYQQRLDIELKIEKIKQRRSKHISQSIIGVIGSVSILAGAYLIQEPSIYWAFIPLCWIIEEL